MNLHGIVRNAIGSVNPDISVIVRLSDGYTTAADGTQVPSYLPDVVTKAQVQALSAEDVRKMDGVNLQKSTNSAYLYGTFNGMLRMNRKGSDLLIINGKEWLITQVLEAWPDWSKVAICLQQFP